MAQDLETINRWTGSAPYWEKHREIIRTMFAGITAGLVADAQVARGQTVLDVATGPGEPALSVAAVVGAEGKVCGIDPVAGMRSEEHTSELQSLRHLVCRLRLEK